MAHQTLTRRMSRRPPRIPPTGMGDRGSLGMRQVASFAAIMNPKLTKSYRCTCVTFDKIQPCSAMSWEGKEKQRLVSSTTISTISRSILSTSLYF
jgi:hypothetical protein